jgi:hypothetical protein
MTMLTDAIAEQIELLPPPTDRVPPDALGYGVDLSCVTDLTPSLAEVDPNTVRAIGEALIRRLTSPRGSVVDDQAYGYDLRALCNRGVTVEALARVASLARAECMKDDRLIEARVTLTYAQAGQSLSVVVYATPHPPSGTFSLTFFVTADGAQLIGSIDQHG